MTSLLTQFNQSLCNSLTTQPENAKSLTIPQPTTNLLAKRGELNDLEDLLVKKHKTQSTQASETNSDSQSENFGSADFAILACSETFDDEDYSLGTPKRQSSEANTENTDALQQALKALELKIKLFDEQNNKKQAVFAEHKAAYAIPIFRETAEFALREAAKVPKKMEEEIEVTYGSIEFPFLSFSATMADLASIRDGTYKFPKVEGGSEEPVKKEKKNKIFKVEKVDRLKKKAKEIKKKIIEKSQKEKITKEKVESRKKKVETEVLEAISKKLEQKRKSKLKSIEEAKKSGKIEVEEPTKKSYKSLTSPFAFATRRKFERKKNKWQVEQDEKLGGLQIQRTVSSEAYSFMFEGTKKKAGLIPVGSEYQVDVSQFSAPRQPENRRAPKMKWSPAEHNEIELNKFLESVEGLSDSIINEEAAINLVLKNGNDLKKTMKFIKANKAKVLKTLVFKPSNNN